NDRRFRAARVALLPGRGRLWYTGAHENSILARASGRARGDSVSSAHAAVGHLWRRRWGRDGRSRRDGRCGRARLPRAVADREGERPAGEGGAGGVLVPDGPEGTGEVQPAQFAHPDTLCIAMRDPGGGGCRGSPGTKAGLRRKTSGGRAGAAGQYGAGKSGEQGRISPRGSGGKAGRE